MAKLPIITNTINHLTTVNEFSKELISAIWMNVKGDIEFRFRTYNDMTNFLSNV